MTTLPNMDDVQVISDWNYGMPYLPMLTKAWACDNPHPNYVNGWYMWCDMDTKATYVMMLANPECEGIALHMGSAVVYVPYEQVVDTEEEGYYEEYDEYDWDYNDQYPKLGNDKVGPEVAMNKYKVGYMWDNNGNGYMMGNKYHAYGWWCLDDILWSMQLWDMQDEYTLKPDRVVAKEASDNIELLKSVYDGKEPNEWLTEMGLQMGGVNVASEVQHLENCLGV